MKVVYISSPYTLGDVAKNVKVQMDAAHRIMDLGHCPIWPLASHFLHIDRARPVRDWMEVDIELVKRSDVVLRLPGESAGADEEVMEALKADVPVCYTWASLEEELQP